MEISEGTRPHRRTFAPCVCFASSGASHLEARAARKAVSGLLWAFIMPMIIICISYYGDNRELIGNCYLVLDASFPRW